MHAGRTRNVVCLVALSLSAHFSFAVTGTVVTTSGRVHGPLKIGDGHITIGRKQIAWKDTMAIATRIERTHIAPNMLRLRSGELWAGTVLGLRNNQVAIRFASLGVRRVDVQRVASIEFFAGRTEEGGFKPGRLYREDGSPISGRLIDISPQAVRITTSLGVFNLQRGDVWRYVFNTYEHETATEDELTHVDGSVFHGRMIPTRGGFEFDHPLLGKARVDLRAVLTLQRRSDKWQWLAPEMFKVTRAEDSLGPVRSPRSISRYGPDYRARPPTWISAIRMDADTAMDLSIEKGGRFMSIAGLLHGRAGPNLSVSAGDQSLAERNFDFADEEVALSFEVNAGQPLSLSFRAGETRSVPCSIVLADPVVVFQ